MQITRAQAKLIKYKDVTQLALQWLQNEEGINIDSLCAPSDNCPSCESEDSYFKKTVNHASTMASIKISRGMVQTMDASFNAKRSQAY